MEFSKQDVVDAILKNDTARVTEMLEEFDLTKDGIPHFNSINKSLASHALIVASAAAYRDGLTENLTKELIERTAKIIDLFDFLRLAVLAGEIGTTNFDIIPPAIRTALEKNIYSDELAHDIENLSYDSFKALLSFIPSDEIEMLDIRLGLPILRRIYADRIVLTHLMLAYMAICLRETVEDKIAAKIAEGSVEPLDTLDAIFNAIFDIDDDDITDDDSDA